MKFKRRKIKRGRVEIIPMIDTIVILLIFYMTFSRFVEASREGKIGLPEARTGGELVQKEDQVVVNLIYNGDSPNKVNITVNKQSYTFAELPGVLRGLRNMDAAKKNHMGIILRADTNVAYQALSDFMKACASAKIIDVTFATLEPAR